MKRSLKSRPTSNKYRALYLNHGLFRNRPPCVHPWRFHLAFPRSRSLGWLLLFGILLHPIRLAAQDCAGGWAADGSATVAPGSVTIGSQAGSAWCPTRIDLSQPFDMTFQILPSGDGMAFVLQNQGLAALGGWGCGLGFGNIYGQVPGPPISPSLDVEIDTYYNNASNTPDIGDPDFDHVAVLENGDMLVNVAGPVAASPVSALVSDGVPHDLRVVWDPALRILSIYIDGNLRLTYNRDLANAVFGGASNVYWGFTGSSVNSDQWAAWPCVDSPTPNATFAPTVTPTPTVTGTPTNTFTDVPTATYTFTPTWTFTTTFTPTPTFTPLAPLRVWPNPFNPLTSVRGTLKCADMPDGSAFNLYTVSGETVFKAEEVGHRVEWDGKTQGGKIAAPGIYYYVVRSGVETLQKGVLVLQR